MSSTLEIPIEKEYYYIFNERYKGKMPSFFDESQFKEAIYIKNNYNNIKCEIIAYLNKNLNKIESGLVPHSSWDGKGWKSIGLYVFNYKRKKNCKHFPFITSLIENIPTLCSAQISIMEPNSKLKPHIDDTSAIVRIHLGITIPGSYPNIGFRMNGKEVCWKEGEILILSPVRPHYAWNNTNHHRIVFIVDVFHNQYLEKKFLISGRVIAQLIMKIIVSRFKFLKKLPKFITYFIHRTFGFFVSIMLIFKDKLKL